MLRFVPFLFLFFASAWLLIAAPPEAVPGTLPYDQNRAEGIAQAMIIQQAALMAWARLPANSGTSGIVQQSALTFPAPWTAQQGLISFVGSTASGPVATTYYTGSILPGAVASALFSLQGPSSDAGVTGTQYLNSAAGAVIPLPAGVPVGNAAVADIVTE